MPASAHSGDQIKAMGARGDLDGIRRLAGELRESRLLRPWQCLAIGKALAECGDRQAALRWFGRIRPGQSGHAAARRLMVKTLLALGKYRRVIEMTAAAGKDGLSEDLAVSRAKALLGMRRAGAAMALIEARAARGRAGVALLAVGAEAALAARNCERALEFLDQAARRAPRDRLVLRRAEILYQFGRDRECLSALRSIADAGPLRAQVMGWISTVEQRRAEHAAALAGRGSLLVLDPTDRSA